MGSVSNWLRQIKGGDQQALHLLVERYYPLLVLMARQRLRGRGRVAAYEDDAALDAVNSFWNRARADRFPQLADRDDVLRVLLMLVDRKVRKRVESENRLKRRAGNESQILTLPRDGSDASDALSQAARDVRRPWTRGRSPEEEAIAAEEFDRLLKQLEQVDPILRDIALDKVDGCKNEEIAEIRGKSLATVERKVSRIRKLLEKEVGDE